ncbi:hypothetical protein [Nocardia sp. NPDC057030]|uniref:hypothetical protein n=1 Tax=unclassified Nocardia TaxID=2637762 RepID=UPI003639451D
MYTSENPAERPGPSDVADPRVAFIYQEALRGLLQQQDAVESLRNRAGTLIFAASFASSLLGSRALDDGLSSWDWLALVLLVGIGALTVVVLWPYYELSFRFKPDELFKRYVDSDATKGMTEMYRDLALRIEADFRSNGRTVRRMRVAFECALVMLLANILAWLFSIANVFG